MAEIWGAALAVAGAVGGAAMSADAAGDASRAQTRGSNASIAEQRRQFDLTRSDTAPYRQIGEQSLNRLGQLQGFQPFSRTTYGDQTTPAGGTQGIDPSTGMMIGPGGSIQQGAAAAPGGAAPGAPDYSSFFASPDFNFRMDQGTQALERSAAARGGLVSGNTGAALQDFGQGLASEEYGNFYNRLASLAGLGQTGVNTATTAGMNTANNISGALTDAGNARASGVAGQSDAWGNALGQIGGIAYDRWGRKKTGT